MELEQGDAISALAQQLGAVLDDIAMHATVGRDPQRLVDRARDLADDLTHAVERLGDDDGSEAARRHAAYLAAKLAMLENSVSGWQFH